MIILQAVTPAGLAEAVAGVPIEEARRIVGAVHRHDHLPATVRNVRRATLDRVRAACTLPSMTADAVLPSRIDPFVKYSLWTHGGELIETVRIPLDRPGRFSVCVSAQAGCALGCAFCATGRLGLSRNLETWEIVEQVRTVRRGLDRSNGERVRGVVFQGMGEPMANLDNVIQSIRIICEPAGLAVDTRAVTVCTAGIPAGIRRLALETPKVRLGVSIGSARRGVRRELMPIDRAHPLEEVFEAGVEHARTTRIAPMWVVTLLAGVNDSTEDALALAGLARRFRDQTGLRPRISIVPYNSIDASGPQTFLRAGRDRETAFRRVLGDSGLASHRRYSGGSDVDAACGQLAGVQPQP